MDGGDISRGGSGTREILATLDCLSLERDREPNQDDREGGDGTFRR